MKDTVRRVTKTAALIAHIKGLGCDKFFTPIGIRTGELAGATGVPANSIQTLLEPSVKNGTLVVCKITGAIGHQEREYRAGPGVPPPEFKPLKTKPAWPDLTRPASGIRFDGCAERQSHRRGGIIAASCGLTCYAFDNERIINGTHERALGVVGAQIQRAAVRGDARQRMRYLPARRRDRTRGDRQREE